MSVHALAPVLPFTEDFQTHEVLSDNHADQNATLLRDERHRRHGQQEEEENGRWHGGGQGTGLW